MLSFEPLLPNQNYFTRRLRKAYPCGSHEWEVVRVGTDVGLECLKCQRGVLLAGDVFRRRVKEFVPKSD